MFVLVALVTTCCLGGFEEYISGEWDEGRGRNLLCVIVFELTLTIVLAVLNVNYLTGIMIASFMGHHIAVLLASKQKQVLPRAVAIATNTVHDAVKKIKAKARAMVERSASQLATAGANAATGLATTAVTTAAKLHPAMGTAIGMFNAVAQQPRAQQAAAGLAERGRERVQRSAEQQCAQNLERLKRATGIADMENKIKDLRQDAMRAESQAKWGLKVSSTCCFVNGCFLVAFIAQVFCETSPVLMIAIKSICGAINLLSLVAYWKVEADAHFFAGGLAATVRNKAVHELTKRAEDIRTAVEVHCSL
jgi:hypothetical protein